MDAAEIATAATTGRVRLLSADGMLTTAAVIDGVDRAITLTEPPPACLALLLASLARLRCGRPVFYIAHDEERAERLAGEAEQFAHDLDVVVIPPWDCFPYDRRSPSRQVMGQRVAALQRLAAAAIGAPTLVVTTAEALAQRVPPASAVAGVTYRLEEGADLDLPGLRAFLLGSGYVLDERVDEPGEAAIRVGIIDIFPAVGGGPYRCQHENGRITAITRYDAVTQLTAGRERGVELSPASELILDRAALLDVLSAGEDGRADALARHNLQALLLGDATERMPGLEHRLPVFYPDMCTLFDYLPDALVGCDGNVADQLGLWQEQVRQAYEHRAASLHGERTLDNGRAPPLRPDRLYLGPTELEEQLQARLRLACAAGAADIDLGAREVPRFFEAAAPERALARFIEAETGRGAPVVLAAETAADRRRLARAVRRQLRREVVELATWADVPALDPGTIALLRLDLGGGFALDDAVVIAAADIGGERRPGGGPSADLRWSLDDWRAGDLVVHWEHGIGVLRGLERVVEDEVARACVVVEYAAGKRLLVPVDDLSRLWRYAGAEAKVSLDRLQGESWPERKAEVEAALAATAARLLAETRRRQAAKGPALSASAREYARFAAGFRYATTRDQQSAIDAALADLARGQPPMNRLVCGDVGYGKTEVALRAAAATVFAGKQVVMIAPTTVLVRQHAETFARRFAPHGIGVAAITGALAKAEARAVLAGVRNGETGILIGTPGLAEGKLQFRDLGLIILDEEHRLGAAQKERLRALNATAHVLTLTATPIPQTLQAAMVGLFDVSIIATPPVRRQPVHTDLLPFDAGIVRMALLRERRLDGQSFFVCPRIADLEPMRRQLADLVPDLEVVVAHGRMKAAELDARMLAFAEGAYDVLLTTSIIESGLDIPRANTILIWRADRFGLAELHQLRGRVGRGRRRAYAYLFTEPDRPLAEATTRRLATIVALEQLGAGFGVAAHDLDQRGAGMLYGEEQAGHVALVGTAVYEHLLRRALRLARGDAVGDDWSPAVRFAVDAYIPDDLVGEVDLRIRLYRRLSTLVGEQAVFDFAQELADRFGPPPKPLRNLLALAVLRERCRRLQIARLEGGPQGIAVTFRDAAAAGRRLAPVLEQQPDLCWSNDRLLAPVAANPRQQVRRALSLLKVLAASS